MRESSLWSWLSRAESSYGRHLHMNRTENVAGVGTPDVEGCLDSRCFVVELKVAERPARPTTAIRTQSPIKTEQVDWLMARKMAGGRAWLLVQVGERHEARRYLLDAVHAADVARGLTENRLEVLCACDPRCSAERLIKTAAYGDPLG